MKKDTAQNTPGPWYRMDKRYSGADRVCIEIATFNADGNPAQHIARVNHCDINPTKEVCDTVAANARLIAAAPDLLEALENLYSRAFAQLDRSATHDGLENCNVLGDARAAIRKATQV